MIAHERGERHARAEFLHGIEPGVPLRVVFAVVDEIAHIDEEIGRFVARGCPMDELLPVTVIVGLGVREEQREERAVLLWRAQHLPVTGLLPVRDAVLVGGAGRQALKGRCILVMRHRVIGE